MTRNIIHLPNIVGRGYGDFWRFKGRYRAVKGSRASKKSKTTALNYITRIMEYPDSNLLVVRKVKDTLRDSCFSDLKWAIDRLGVSQYWSTKVSPLEITYIPTGQKILFRGLDDPLKITSITVDKGYLCWMWIEEAYEIMNEDDFDMLDESIRGEVPDHLFKQITLTFNPWSEKHFLKTRFFDEPDPQVLAKSTNYLCNEFLDQSDLDMFERMKKHNPKRYKVAGLGEWGITDGLVFENWTERMFNIEDVISSDTVSVFGLDFGYVNDPTAFVGAVVDEANLKIYIFDEMYEKGLSNREICKKLIHRGKEKIMADSSERREIDELRRLGLRGIKPTKKDRIMTGVQYLQDYQIIIHPSCVNFVNEISNYTWATDKFGDKINMPIDDNNHLMDALRYATEPLRSGTVTTLLSKNNFGI